MQLAGVVAVEIAGGPEIPFHPGREACLLSFLDFKNSLVIYLRVIDLDLLPETCNFFFASGWSCE